MNAANAQMAAANIRCTFRVQATAATPLPTLSQVEAMDTAYLREAADYWTRTISSASCS